VRGCDSAKVRRCLSRFVIAPSHHRTTLTWLIVFVYAMVFWIAWPRLARSHGSITTTVLFDREIVRILSNHCVMCHSDQSISFPLSTYEQTWVRGRDIRAQVLRRHMPPWSAVAGYGEFANDNNLTMRETQFLVSWVEGLGPRNAGTVFLNVARPDAAAAEVRAEAHVGHWQLGEPDVSRQLTPTRVESRQADFVQRIVVDPGLTSERQVRALEFQPGDRRVVRAATFFVESTGQWLGSWTPWYGFAKLPEGVAARLPARSRIVADLHYRGADRPVVDQGTLGLFVNQEKASTISSDIVLDAKAISPSRFRASIRLSRDTRVWAFRPDLVPDIASIEVSARTPDGGTDILLLAKNPAVEWPTPYILKAPRLLRRGTEVSFVVQRREGAPAGGRMRLTMSRY
jgi:hypothetical protein